MKVKVLEKNETLTALCQRGQNAVIVAALAARQANRLARLAAQERKEEAARRAALCEKFGIPTEAVEKWGL